MRIRRRRDTISRRLAILQLASAGAVLSAPACSRLVDGTPRLRDDPFTLGVASGYPRPDSVVLWTRLLPRSDEPRGGLPADVVPVEWEVAADESFRKIARRGRAVATADLAYSVHVEPVGLKPGRPYWYRFIAGGVRSPAGRTATAPSADVLPPRLRVAVASCQHYEQGLYVAYRHLVADAPDLVVHVGDYIYESGSAGGGVRSHGSAECHTLDDYRARYALYRSDPHLQAAHAVCPWILTWDDHEVDNDYAADVSEHDEDPERFLARRAAAYQAYYEHTPLPRQARPSGADLHLYGERSWGRLASLIALDTRQYRAAHACPPPGRRGARRVSECEELRRADRSKLGEQQEAWLAKRLAASASQWHLLAQGTLLTYLDEQPGPGELYWTDSWNGYPAARQRLLDVLRQGVANPVVLSGDIHAFVVAELDAVAGDRGSGILASEFVTTSISSRGLPPTMVDAWLKENSHVRLARPDLRGYLRLDLEPDSLRTDLIAMDSVSDPAAGCRVLASYVVESGRAGPMCA